MTNYAAGKRSAGRPGRGTAAACAACCALLCFVPIVSAGGPGSTALQMLKAEVSPRAMSMGGGFAAIADDIYAAHYNPAGLGQLGVPSASAMYYSGFEDSRLQYLAAGMPAPIPGLAGLDRPTLALSAVFTQNGSFTPRTLNPDDTVTVGDTVNAQSDRIVAVSYGEKVYSAPVRMNGRAGVLEHYLGLSAKHISSTLLEQYSASGFALDAGWLVRETALGLSFGIALSNYGSGLKYLRDTDRISSTARSGVAWRGRTIRDHTLTVTHEYDRQTGEGLSSARSGLEYNFEKMFSVRLGYKGCGALWVVRLKDCDMSSGNKGVTFGVGARHEGFAVDLGASIGNAVFDTTQVALSYRFTGWTARKPPVRRRYTVRTEPEPAVRKKAAPVKKRPAKRAEPARSAPAEGIFWIE